MTKQHLWQKNKQAESAALRYVAAASGLMKKKDKLLLASGQPSGYSTTTIVPINIEPDNILVS